MNDLLSTKIEFLKGVGPQKGLLLNKELNIYVYRDALLHYPFRHEDRTRIYQITELQPDLSSVMLKGFIKSFETVGDAYKKRLVAIFADGSGEMELLWFQGIQWMCKSLKLNTEYLVFGKAQLFNAKYSIIHPEIEIFVPGDQQTGYLQPVYSTTENLKKKFLGSKAIGKIVKTILDNPGFQLIENLSQDIIQHYHFLSRQEAIRQIHFPTSQQMLQKAKARLKFEELFFIQLKLLKIKQHKTVSYKGRVCKNTDLLKKFYSDNMPFELTGAQKKVVKEIFADMSTGKQMNRLLQGDVGSGKTIVAFLSMLIAISNQCQVCMMAPTEILAEQHYQNLKKFADTMGLTIDLLTGTTANRDRRIMHERLMNGNLNILIGTHALIEDKVQFENLGLCIIDEQHRFGVEQRSRLWEKKQELYPHVLVMTATPIPRTLAMTLYGDLDVSVIDELPKGRKPIKTAHRFDAHRLRVFSFLKEQIKEGRQIYIVYPLIEESEKLDFKNLMDGYESISRAFPEHHLSILHGKMSSVDKDYEMRRFIKRETQLMVATTVIEVGVDVPNASVMVIESAERFGLSQLHQLRGRVGRGAEQSYCILMTDYKLSKESKLRIDTMVRTNNGFEIAEVDLKLRGPGNLMGKEQSGVLDLVIADLAQDGHILKEAREMATQILKNDPALELEKNLPLKRYLMAENKQENYWSRIS